jgi:hypothetical protein
MPRFITSIKLLAATDKDYIKLSQEMERQSFLPGNKPVIIGNQSESCEIVFKSTTRISLLEATTAVSQATSRVGKKFSFTIIKDK